MSAQVNSERRRKTCSVARRGRQEQAAAGRRDFGGGRSFFAGDDRRGHLGRGRGDRGRRLRTLEGMLASAVDAVLTGRSSATLARGSNSALAGRIDAAGAQPPSLHLGCVLKQKLCFFFRTHS